MWAGDTKSLRSNGLHPSEQKSKQTVIRWQILSGQPSVPSNCNTRSRGTYNKEYGSKEVRDVDQESAEQSAVFGEKDH